MLAIEFADLLVHFLYFRRLFSRFNQQQCAFLSQIEQLRFDLGSLFSVSVGERGCGARRFRRVVSGLGSLAFAFCFEQLAVQAGEALDDCVLVRIERDDLIVARVVDETFFTGANLLLKFCDALLEKPSRGAVCFRLLFEV